MNREIYREVSSITDMKYPINSIVNSLHTYHPPPSLPKKSKSKPKPKPKSLRKSIIAMDDPSWAFFFLLTLTLTLLFALSLLHLSPTKPAQNLPPGPPSIPSLTSIRRLFNNRFHIASVLRDLRAKYGPILALRFILSRRPTIFISDRALAHEALVLHGPALADRLPTSETGRVFSGNGLNISSAPYGPLWRSLRRNLSSEILHPSKIKHFAHHRKWVLSILLDKLEEQAADDGNGVVIVMESFQFAMFCLLVLMCFGKRLDVEKIREIEDLQKRLQRSFFKFLVFAFFPSFTKILFRKNWKMLLDIRRRQAEIFVPLIRTPGVCSYVESLLELSIPGEGGRKLTEGEIVSLCSEFLSAGTDTAATALEWTMAELVKHSEIQEKLLVEIEGAVPTDEEIKEEDLPKMRYLKAVILEALRRHPPAHFLLPHRAAEDVEIGGYAVPKGATVNFMVAEVGLDEKVWEEPMEFRPERFMVGGEGEGVDITGSREIKMMPFGAGRRICPGLGLAMLHLEYFVANLVREFEWTAVDGEKIDLSEKWELTVVMKNHLRAMIIPRRENKKCLV